MHSTMDDSHLTVKSDHDVTVRTTGKRSTLEVRASKFVQLHSTGKKSGIRMLTWIILGVTQH